MHIEANEALSPKDFLHRVKICLKEAKESRLWLRLLDTHEVDGLEEQRADLIQESTELMNIFGAIIRYGRVIVTVLLPASLPVVNIT